MIRTLWFLLKILAVVGAAIWVADRSGHVTIEWQNVVVETSTALLVAAVALLMVVTYSLTRFIDSIRTTSRLYRMHEALRYQRRGHKLLGEALDAISVEKPKRAISLLKRAEKMIGPSHMVEIVKARAGKEDTQAPVAVADLSSPFAWRDAIENNLERGNAAQARQLAEQFAQKNPDLVLPKKLLLQIYLHEAQWNEALNMLDFLRSVNAMPRKDIRAQRAVVFAERARLAIKRHDYAEGFEYAMHADRLRPVWAPAILQASAALAGQDKPREAANLIARSWAQAAHEQLADIYVTLKHFKNPLKMAQESERLARKAPSLSASHWLLLQAGLAARLYGEARHHGEALVVADPSRKVFNAMARIEDMEKNDKAAAGRWLLKGEASRPDPAWICASCKKPHSQWQALCAACKAFDTLAWGHPLSIADERTDDVQQIAS